MHHDSRPGLPPLAALVSLTLVVLLGASGVTVVAHPAGQMSEPPAGPERAGAFRQFPGGKEISNLRAELTARLAAAALRADADRQLPEGFRVRDDGAPVVAPVSGNRLFRFGLEYDGVRLASADYVAIVGQNGRLLASRFRNIPRSVDATVPTVDPATARAVATMHARGTLGQAGTLSATHPRLELWVDEQQQGRLSLVGHAPRGVGRHRTLRHAVSGRGDRDAGGAVVDRPHPI